MQAKHRLIQRARLPRLRPLRRGPADPLEKLRLNIGDSELQQAARMVSAAACASLGCPAIAWSQAVSHRVCQVLNGAPPGHTPGLPVLQQPSHRLQLGLALRSSSRCRSLPSPGGSGRRCAEVF